MRLREGFLDAEAEGLKADVCDLGVSGVEEVRIARVYYVTGALDPKALEQIAERLLIDPITEEVAYSKVDTSKDGTGYTSEQGLLKSVPGTEVGGRTVEVAYHPGVRDPVEDSLKKGAEDLGIDDIAAVHTAKAVTLGGEISGAAFNRICEKLLVNATIQQVVTPENLKKLLSPTAAAPMAIETVHLLKASDTVLQRISLDHQLSLSLAEMHAIQSHFQEVGREPALIELETLAQTWSEHCKHKTLRGSVDYIEEREGKTTQRTIPNLLGQTIVRATEELAKPWCVSVFVDNSGVIRFDEDFDVCFKVETHNHPSALEPFGGASTGIGGVIRDVLGTGLAAKPIASTDVFCFAPPDLESDKVPQGVLSPRRIIKGVVAGVKDYGNKMGIPTVNGAVCFDERFVGNPLVYCGNVGLLPAGKVTKQVASGMVVLVVGGRTGRDGIHGATFSSIELETESEVISSGAVQIGDAITEKKMGDALLEARDQELFSAVTDCGAGGLSSAVGEMGETCGARVDLEKVPLKYAGLTPAEIWISESQERMVLAVLPEKLKTILELFRMRGVEATPIGTFTDTGKLELLFKGEKVGELSMDFLHKGVPQVRRPARWSLPAADEPKRPSKKDWTETLLTLLKNWDTCSKEWIIRQYDHEVQGGSVLKPLTEGPLPFGKAQGERRSGPSDAAVVRPRLDSQRGIVLANGINFRYGDLDPYWMAVLALEEVVRQVTAVGGSLDHLAVLDNFCFGSPGRPEVLGALVRTSEGCYDAAKAFGTPFISGKDSLHNEYKMGEETIEIPGTLLVSGIGLTEDVTKTISMDAKKAGNLLYVVGVTKEELGGSTYYASLGAKGSQPPQVDLKRSPKLLKTVSKAIRSGLVEAAHDCSEGGLGVAAAEMAFAGGLGLTLDLRKVPAEGSLREDALLFSESPTRLLLEVSPEKAQAFEKALAGLPLGSIGAFEAGEAFSALGQEGQAVVKTTVSALRQAWEEPFKGW